MQSAIKPVSLILALVGLANWGYAAYRTFNGTPFEDSLPLIIVGLICFALIAVLRVVGSRKG